MGPCFFSMLGNCFLVKHDLGLEEDWEAGAFFSVQGWSIFFSDNSTDFKAGLHVIHIVFFHFKCYYREEYHFRIPHIILCSYHHSSSIFFVFQKYFSHRIFSFNLHHFEEDSHSSWVLCSVHTNSRWSCFAVPVTWGPELTTLKPIISRAFRINQVGKENSALFALSSWTSGWSCTFSAKTRTSLWFRPCTVHQYLIAFSRTNT